MNAISVAPCSTGSGKRPGVVPTGITRGGGITHCTARREVAHASLRTASVSGTTSGVSTFSGCGSGYFCAAGMSCGRFSLSHMVGPLASRCHTLSQNVSFRRILSFSLTDRLTRRHGCRGNTGKDMSPRMATRHVWRRAPRRGSSVFRFVWRGWVDVSARKNGV